MARYQTGNWSHGLFGCLSDVQLSLLSLVLPCMVHGQTAESVQAGPCLPCGVSTLVPCLHIYSLAYVRGIVREQRGIDGTVANDVVASVLCPYCVVVQSAQEIGEFQSPFIQPMARE